MTTDHCDIALNKMSFYQLNSMNPEKEAEFRSIKDKSTSKGISAIRNKELIKETENEKYPKLNDQYVNVDPYKIPDIKKKEYIAFEESLTDKDRDLLNGGYNFYQLDFENVGGLVMPIILEFTFDDETTELIRIPAEIWLTDNFNVSKVFIFQKTVKSVQMDPYLETADTELDNNSWPSKSAPSRFSIFNDGGYKRH